MMRGPICPNSIIPEWYLEGFATFTCPDRPVVASDGRTIVGCGATFQDTPDPSDGWLDCPECGLMFDPAHAENQPVQVKQ